RPYSWWQHPNDLVVPTGVWTPVPWNLYGHAASGQAAGADEFGVNPAVHQITTTIAAGSDAAALPQATINVADASAFSSTGWIVITGPPGAGDDTIVSYTGKTATSFTGCNSSLRGGGTGISSGTLATGQVVTQAGVEMFYPTGYLWMTIAEVALANVPTTSYIGLRYRTTKASAFFVPIATHHTAGINIALQHIQMSVQPGALPDTGHVVEVFHNAGSNVLLKKDGIQSPSLMQAFMSTR
ncbi:MAG TPA: hypothetical protein VD926_03690, partial [Acidimicrobiales bacterium]|nr:hypothetical protein [Acidimicrobiales bacterium]